MTRRRFDRRAFGLVAVVGALLLASCGGDPPRGLAGYRRDPAPMVGDVVLPDLAADGEASRLVAPPDRLLVLYFGYTNCPDFCPTTLSDLRLAVRRLEPEQASRIQMGMVTIDPDRDLPVLADYVTSFFPDGRAYGTSDQAALATAAAPFGVSYQVDRTTDGEIEVAHTTSLYAVDDAGRLVLTWQFGVPIDDLAADLSTLLDTSDPGSGSAG
ncbi:MAG: SCO family protein [Ilumatobacteraceae bacterium]